MLTIRTHLLACLSFFVLLAANADAPHSAKQPLGLAERVSIGPTLFMFHRDFCARGACSLGEYRGIARKRDEAVVWQSPDGKVILRAYETDNGEVLVLLGDPARWDRAVDRVDIRFARFNTTTGALTPTPYRYIVEARLPGVRSAYIGMRVSATERHANGNPKATHHDLIDASGRLLASVPARSVNEVMHDIPDECYNATVLWQFALVGETDGEWAEVAYSGDPLRLPDPKADKAALKRWCDDAVPRVWATRDRKGIWTARLAETFLPLAPTPFTSAADAFRIGVSLSETARRRLEASRKVDQWALAAVGLNAEWNAERTKRFTADQQKASALAATQRDAIAAQRAADAQPSAAVVQASQAAAEKVLQAQRDTEDRAALRAKKHKCSYTNPLSAPELEACSDLQKRLLQSYEWSGWVWVNRSLLAIHRVARPLEEALREKARHISVAPDDDLIKSLISITCLEPESPAAAPAQKGPTSAITAIVEWTRARHNACGHLVPASASECYCTFDPRNEFVAGKCQPKKFQPRTGPTAAEIEREKRFQACSKQVVAEFSRR